MAGRRRQRTSSNGIMADPSKDLFAYLFLMIMIFCFMLMMATHEIVQGVKGQDSPAKQEAAAGSSLAHVNVEGIGRLLKQGNDIFIAYGDHHYSPKTDLEAMRADGRVMTLPGKDGKDKQVLYIEETSDQQVLLTEYLEAFGYLSRQGIGVAFAERAEK